MSTPLLPLVRAPLHTPEHGRATATVLLRAVPAGIRARAAGLGEKPDRRGRRDPCAVATRAFAGAPSLGTNAQAAEIMERGTEATGALS
jgi:hypothetical protein